MALTRRAVAVTLAALTIAGGAAEPAQAYWHSTGRGTGTVLTAAGTARLLTLSLSVKNGKVTASGDAGATAAYGNVTVALCSASPCSTDSTSLLSTGTVSHGNGNSGYSYSYTPPGNLNLSGRTVYGTAIQIGAGWPDKAFASVLYP